MATINALTQELVTLAKDVTEIAGKGYSVYDMDDLSTVVQYETLPIVGISYEGMIREGKQAEGKTLMARSAGIQRINFSILLALRYESASSTDDTKVDAVALLDSLRSTILGFKGVNTRGWTFNGESPLASNIEGVIFYGQSWSSNSPITGNFGQ